MQCLWVGLKGRPLAVAHVATQIVRNLTQTSQACWHQGDVHIQDG